MIFKKERDRLRREYGDHGWQTFPVVGKQPRSGLSWNKPFKGDWRDDENIGVVLGAKSGGLIDVDLDWPEAAEMATLTLGGGSNRCFGRAGARYSHMLFMCPGVKRTKFVLPKSFLKLDVPSEHALMVAEIRGDGCYTVFPGSRHPSGELVEWENDAQIRLVEQGFLERTVGIAAFAAVCARFWPGDGAQHDAALAFAGICKRADIPEGHCAKIVSAITAGDKEQGDRLRAVKDTYLSEKEVSGWKKLQEAFGFPADAAGIFAGWLGIKSQHAFDNLNGRYAVIKDGSKVRIGTLTPDPIAGRETWHLMNQSDFLLLERQSKEAKMWLESPARREYPYGFIFDPMGGQHQGS